MCKNASIRSPVVAACLSPILLVVLSITALSFAFLHLAFTRVDIRIVSRGFHLGVAGTSDSLRDFLLLLIMT